MVDSGAAVQCFELFSWSYRKVGGGDNIADSFVKQLSSGFPQGLPLYGNPKESGAGYETIAGEVFERQREIVKEMMALYQKEVANPLGGCLPMLLPMPIFLALYWVLLSRELRHTPFILWIESINHGSVFCAAFA